MHDWDWLLWLGVCLGWMAAGWWFAGLWSRDGKR